jgi:hypothetical protein
MSGSSPGERRGLAQEFAHVRSHIGEPHLMFRIGQRAEQQLAIAGDVTPRSGLTVALGRRGELTELAASGGIQAVAALFGVDEDAATYDAKVAAGDGRARQVIGAVRLLNVGQRELPQVATVVGIDRSQCPDPLDKHTSVLKQRSVTSAVPLRHLQVNVAEPERTQLPFDDLVGRARTVAEVRILMRPTAGLRQRSASDDAHLADPPGTDLTAKWPQRLRRIIRRHVERPSIERPRRNHQVGKIFAVANMLWVPLMDGDPHAVQTEHAQLLSQRRDRLSVGMQHIDLQIRPLSQRHG